MVVLLASYYCPVILSQYMSHQLLSLSEADASYLYIYISLYRRSILGEVGITSGEAITLLTDIYAEHIDVLRDHLKNTGSINNNRG